jgi:hypothetical protein
MIGDWHIKEKALKTAHTIGRADGENAASWWQQDAIGGRVSSRIDVRDVVVTTGNGGVVERRFLEEFIGERVSFVGADGQRHYAGRGLRIEDGYRDGVRLVCSGRPGYDQPGEVCRLAVVDDPQVMRV